MWSIYSHAERARVCFVDSRAHFASSAARDNVYYREEMVELHERGQCAFHGVMRGSERETQRRDGMMEER